jgi:tetratricopeptide (TPR) repeat protein
LEAEKAFGEARRLDFNYDNLRTEYEDGRNLYVAYEERTDRAKTGAIGRTVAMPILPEPTLPQLKSQAVDALKQGLFDIALGQFTHILEVDAKGTDVWVWCGRGAAHLGRNEPDLAILDFERAIDLAPNSASAYCLRGQAYAMKGDYYQTIIDTSKAIRLKPDYAQAYYHRAIADLKKGDFEHALADLDVSVKLNPKSEVQARSAFVAICSKQGITYVAERSWDEAIANLQTAISADQKSAGQLNPHLVQAYVEQGFDHLAAQHWNKAIASFERAISLDKNKERQLNPHRAQAYAQQGFDLANRHEFKTAVSDLNRACELHRENAQVYRLCGLTCCLMAKDCHDRGAITDAREQWEDAMKYLKRAIWLDRDLDHVLRYTLEDIRRELDRISAPAGATPVEL